MGAARFGGAYRHEIRLWCGAVRSLHGADERGGDSVLQVPVSRAVGTPITTIEGLSTDGTHPVQMAWKEFDVPQCGYCQSGQILSAVALLSKHPKPTDADIDAQMTNACRCGTYYRIRQAVHRAAALLSGSGEKA